MTRVDVKKECTYNLAEIRKCMESPFPWALSELLTDTRNKEYSSMSPLTPGGSGLESLPSKCKF